MVYRLIHVDGCIPVFFMLALHVYRLNLREKR